MTKWSNWEELMTQAQKGNTKMYNQLLSEVATYLGPYLRFKVGSESIASELVQETLISVHTSRHTFDPQRPFKPWLFKIVQSRLIDFYRKDKNRKELQSSIEAFSVESFTAEAEISQIEVDELKEILTSLSDDQREIVLALKINGQSIKEVAESRNMSESAVKTSAHRAYKAMSLKLGVDV